MSGDKPTPDEQPTFSWGPGAESSDGHTGVQEMQKGLVAARDALKAAEDKSKRGKK